MDARVDWMIAAAVEDASRAGNLAAVRWLYSLAPLSLRIGSSGCVVIAVVPMCTQSVLILCLCNLAA